MVSIAPVLSCRDIGKGGSLVSVVCLFRSPGSRQLLGIWSFHSHSLLMTFCYPQGWRCVVTCRWYDIGYHPPGVGWIRSKTSPSRSQFICQSLVFWRRGHLGPTGCEKNKCGFWERKNETAAETEKTQSRHPWNLAEMERQPLLMMPFQSGLESRRARLYLGYLLFQLRWERSWLMQNAAPFCAEWSHSAFLWISGIAASLYYC